MSTTAKQQDLNADQQSCAAWIARFLRARGIDRIFGLQGGHIPDRLDVSALQSVSSDCKADTSSRSGIMSRVRESGSSMSVMKVPRSTWRTPTRS
jgi:hypothetical protein